MMANFVPFQTQITSIMGVFVDAAVTQICELVDEGYAVLRLEISRSQKENEELKEKLLRMEMGNMLGLGNITPAVHERTPFYATSDEDGRSERRSSLEPEFDILCDRVEPQSPCGDDPGQANSDKSKEKFPFLIKKEILEDDFDVTWSHKEQDINRESSCADDEGNMDIIGLNETNCASKECGLVVKADPEDQSPVQTIQKMEDPSAEQRDTEFQTSLNNKSLFPSAGTDSDDPSCSNAADIGPSFFSSSPRTQMSMDEKSTGEQLFPVKFHSVKPEVVTLDSEAHHENSQSNRNALLHQMQRGLSGHDGFGNLSGRHFSSIRKSQRENRAGRRLPIAPRIMPATGHQIHSGGNQEKQFICGFCGKSFTGQRYLQAHQRVHTGEKPYSCSHCGKRFGQASYLRKHQTIHTGVKPYGCPLCGKRFADSSNLIRHKGVHTGERPFICIHCGLRFAVKHNLRIHLQKNHPHSSGSQIGDVF